MAPGLAPQLAALKRRLFNLPAPARSSGEASNGQPVQVEMLVAGTWIDITDPYTMVRDDSGNIPVSTGIQGGEGSQTERAQAKLVLKNQDGRFSPRNPSGPYYGAIGRNTQFRISVPDGNGGKSYRIWGEASAWEPGWDSTGTDVWVDVTIVGIMQRLAQAPTPERSVIYNAITSPPPSGLVAYWPMEDPTGSTQLASALTSGSPMTWTGTPNLASYEGFSASDPLPDLTSASLSGGVAHYDDPTATQCRFLLYVPKAGLADGKLICAIDQLDYSSGSAQIFELYYSTTDASNSLVLRTLASDGTFLGIQLPNTLDVRGRLLYVSIELQESGTAITRQMQLKDVATGRTYTVSDTQNLTQLTRVTKVSFGIASRAAAGPTSTANLPGTVIGHATLENAITTIDALGVRLNPVGETAGRRIQRLCGEAGIPFEWIGSLDDTVPLGAQPKQNTLALVQEACLADGGLLYETKDVLGLGYRTRASLTQDPVLVLSYTGYNLADIPVPVEDDRQIQNSLTVTVNGVSATYTETDGTLGTDSIGTYGENTGLTLNLASTDTPTLLDAAAWRVHLGTVDEARYPTIAVNLAHPSITPDLKRAILGLRMGDRAQITGMPSWLPPDNPDQLAVATDETITQFEHKITLSCAPASPYSYIGYLDTTARIDTDGSQLLTAIGSADTSIDIAPVSDPTMLWTTSTSDVPLDVRMGGEVMRVTAIGPKVSDTFTRVTASGWGTADTGQAWSTAGGSASDFSTNGTQGLHSVGSVNASRYTVLTAPTADVDVQVQVATSALATGGPQYAHVVARYLDANNLYAARLAFQTDQTVILTLQKRVGGGQTDLTAVTTPLTHAAGTFYTLRFQLWGSLLRAKAWAPATDGEPPWLLTTTDTALTVAGSVGARTVLDATNTNTLPVTFTFDGFQVTSPQTFTVTRSINGVVKAHNAGEPVSLAFPTILSL
ncbi:hypothetical protein EDD90_3315 [Streptomyces sp. Ag109_O5-1]|uniref:hypothetical protein n=1 Tax=Streptomyces sp. Ag109_O5-1 TaxID=1938851 RepID=UPI000F4ECE7E|nr:hypothetical protein [Streptomyces sp. Ag109_O5-1]RPE40279.1 hypothetical protein EDD90_3315 [Streptomyces sp. Ag109_O5-1]